MIRRIGHLNTPALLSVTPGRTTDPSQTPTWTHKMILSASEAAGLRVGDPAAVIDGLSGDYIDSISGVEDLGGNLCKATITTLGQPQKYTVPVRVTARFLPHISITADPHQFKPWTAEVMGRDEITFVREDQIGIVNLPQPEQPMYDGNAVSNYGAVFNSDGNLVTTITGGIARTTPSAPPKEPVVASEIERWRAGYYKITTTRARRPD